MGPQPAYRTVIRSSYSFFVPAILVTAMVLFGGIPSSAHAKSEHPSTPARETTVASLMAHMTLRQKVGQMLMISFGGSSVSAQTANLLSRIQPGGVTLFGPNFVSASQLKSLDSSLQKHSHIPLIISVDQEGGEVDRVTSGVKQLPSEAEYGRLNNAKLVKSDTSTEGAQLHALGINMDLAPVLDVATPSSIIGSEQRSYGNNAEEDSKLGLAAINGYQSHGIAAVAKHVVGLGTTSVNPETQLPILNLSPSELNRQLSPFRAAAKDNVDGLMVTHVILTGVTSAHTPASLSYNVVTKILRDRFHFKGILMTDSLTMGAVTSRFGLSRACTMAVEAGEDVLLVTPGATNNVNQLQAALNAVVAKVKGNAISMQSINASVTRILKLKQKLHLGLPKT